MRNTMKKMVGIFLIILFLDVLTSCKEWHKKTYVECNDDRLYYSNECNIEIFGYNVNIYILENENTGYSKYKGSNYYYLHKNDSQEAILDITHLIEDDSSYNCGYVLYDAKEDIVYLRYSAMPLNLYTSNDEVIYGPIEWEMTFNQNGEYSVEYNDKDLVGLVKKYWSANYYREGWKAEKIQAKFLEAMLDCRNITNNYEVKEEKYSINVPLYNWYNPWGKIVIGGIIVTSLLSTLGFIYFLMKNLYK